MCQQVDDEMSEGGGLLFMPLLFFLLVFSFHHQKCDPSAVDTVGQCDGVEAARWWKNSARV